MQVQITTTEEKKEMSFRRCHENNCSRYYDSSWPKISVITPSFNQGEFIEATILSVLNQNYPNLEYFIIDGGSTDNTLDIIKKHAHNITFWVSEPDNGQADALNKGLEKATGNIIGYLNSDDIYYPESLFKIAMAYLSEPEPDLIIIGDCKYGTDPGNITTYDSPNFPKTLFEAVSRSGLCPQPSTFWTVNSETRQLRFNADLQFCMDYEFWLKLLKADYTVKRILEPLSFFRIHDAAKSSTLCSVREYELASVSTLYSKYLNDQESLSILNLNQSRTHNIIYSNTKKAIKEGQPQSLLQIFASQLPLVKKLKLAYFRIRE